MKSCLSCVIVCAALVGCSRASEQRSPSSKVYPTIAHPSTTAYQEFRKLDEIAARLDAFRSKHAGQLPTALRTICDEAELVCSFVDPATGERSDWLYYGELSRTVVLASPKPVDADQLRPLKVSQGKYRLLLNRDLRSEVLTEDAFHHILGR